MDQIVLEPELDSKILDAWSRSLKFELLLHSPARDLSRTAKTCRYYR